VKLLLVDDSGIMRERIVRVVSRFRDITIVEEAEDVATAVKGISKHSPDIIILDLRVRGGSGLDVLKRTVKGKDYTLAIVLTNYPFPEYREKCAGLGADYFLDKATEFEDIPEILDRFLQQSASKEERASRDEK